MKKFIVIASALLLGLAAFAQESNKDANGNTQFGPYETNKFWDNWFVEVGAGLNYGFDPIKSLGKVGKGLNVQAAAGKWFDPCFGARVGYEGLKTAGGKKFNYIHADFLWNVSNQFGGYKETRLANIVPYITTGYAFGDAKSFGIGAGIEVPIRITGAFNIVPKIEGVVVNADIIGKYNAGAALNASAAIALRYNIGKNNWTRKSTTVAASAAALAASEAAQNALRASNEKLAAETAAAKAAEKNLASENASLKKALADAEKDNKAIAINLAENPIYAYFEIGKTTLSEKELAHLDYQVKTALAQNKDQKLSICGSADAKTGTKKRNEYLSKKRGEYLFNLLTEKYGLNADNFTVTSKVGDYLPQTALNRAAIISK